MNATTPLWTALIAAIFFHGSMRPGQVVGLMPGLAGVVVLAWDTFIGGGSALALAIGAAVLATLFSGFAVNFSKRHLAGVSPFVAALGVVCTGFAYVLFFRLVEHVGAAYAASVTFLIPIFGTALASGKFGWMLARGDPAATASQRISDPPPGHQSFR